MMKTISIVAFLGAVTGALAFLGDPYQFEWQDSDTNFPPNGLPELEIEYRMRQERNPNVMTFQFYRWGCTGTQIASAGAFGSPVWATQGAGGDYKDATATMEMDMATIQTDTNGGNNAVWRWTGPPSSTNSEGTLRICVRAAFSIDDDNGNPQEVAVIKANHEIEIDFTSGIQQPRVMNLFAAPVETNQDTAQVNQNVYACVCDNGFDICQAAGNAQTLRSGAELKLCINAENPNVRIQEPDGVQELRLTQGAFSAMAVDDATPTYLVQLVEFNDVNSGGNTWRVTRYRIQLLASFFETPPTSLTVDGTVLLDYDRRRGLLRQLEANEEDDSERVGHFKTVVEIQPESGSATFALMTPLALLAATAGLFIW